MSSLNCTVNTGGGLIGLAMVTLLPLVGTTAVMKGVVPDIKVRSSRDSTPKRTNPSLVFRCVLMRGRDQERNQPAQLNKDISNLCTGTYGWRDRLFISLVDSL